MKDIFWAIMDLEKTLDTIDRHGILADAKSVWSGGKLLKAVQSFDVESKACVRVRMDVIECRFPVNVGSKQGDVSMVVYHIYGLCG